MRLVSFIRAITVIGCVCLPISAQPPGEGDEPMGEMTPREEVMDILLSERGSEEAFKKAVERAREIGIAGQAILEARFLFHVDRHEDDALAAMLPEFIERRESFKLSESEIFAVKEDWLAVVEYVQAIAALKKGNKDDFKKHITEAFWLSPRQGAAFAPHIDRLRLNEAMRTVRVDFNRKLAPLAGGEAVPLNQMLGANRAMVLHFWSPWSRECEATLPGLAEIITSLTKSKIGFASVLPEHAPKVLENARNMVKALENPGPAWFIDDEENPLNRELRVQSVPVVILVSPEGRVLFNGHPDDDLFWKSLQEVSPDLVRPALDHVPEEP
jgi:hypothetical protein